MAVSPHVNENEMNIVKHYISNMFILVEAKKSQREGAVLYTQEQKDIRSQWQNFLGAAFKPLFNENIPNNSGCCCMMLLQNIFNHSMYCYNQVRKLS